MALKLSIGVMLLRIAVSKTHKIIIWTAVVIVEVYSLGFFLLFVMQCLPSRYFWTRFTGGQGSCINPDITVNATYAYSAISCAVDWTLGLLPISLVWNLQMNPRTKLSVAAILALGAMYVIPFNHSPLCLHADQNPEPRQQQSFESLTSKASLIQQTSFTPRQT